MGGGGYSAWKVGLNFPRQQRFDSQFIEPKMVVDILPIVYTQSTGLNYDYDARSFIPSCIPQVAISGVWYRKRNNS